MTNEFKPSSEMVDYVLCEMEDRLCEAKIDYLAVSDENGMRTAIVINRKYGSSALDLIQDELPLWIEPSGDICRITALF